MSKYFSLFPKIPYNIGGQQYSTFTNATDILFRIRVLRSVLNNIAAYYEYIIRDGDRPDILAEKLYGDAEAHWVVLLANDIIDVEYGWPLNDRDFNKYIVKRYHSIENAKTMIHHYEKVIERTESFSGVTTETRFIINETKLAKNVASSLVNLPYEYYQEPLTNLNQYGTYGQALPETQAVESFNLGYANNKTNTLSTKPLLGTVNTGRTITEVYRREAVSYYDYEYQLNESKRTIKLIKKEYYPQIIQEFDKLTDNARNPSTRRLIV